MGEIAKPDALTAHVSQLRDASDDLAAMNRRRLLVDSTGQASASFTSSTAYVDLGPTIVRVRPGPGGRVLVGLTVNADYVPSGEGLLVSFRTNGGPTSVASSDWRAWKLLNNSGGDMAAASTHWTQTPKLDPGLYDFIMTVRCLNGIGASVTGRELIITPSTAMPAS